MNCPNCQTLNPAGARFCFNCGHALPQVCTNCGASLQSGARFCSNCGHPVTAGEVVPAPVPEVAIAPIAQPPAKPLVGEDLLQRFIPRELLTKLESARDSGLMEGERRIVTILFCDVKGSTLAASHLDPEEWAEIINGAFEYMIQPVYRYEGTVARLQGDGLLAFFGAPIAHEDDPQRAILAGLEIVRATQEYGEQVKRDWGIDFAVRVGINTGLVVVGAVGSDLRVEYSALGDAINLAARMEQSAMPGTVQVAKGTHKLVEPIFDFEVIENLEVKGREAPVTAYRVLGKKAEPGSLRGIAGLSAPLIGRKSQMDALWSAAEGLKGGRGQVVSVIAEAGLGKSRLISEFHQALSTDPSIYVAWLEGRSFSYDAATPYTPFITLFEDFFGLLPGEGGQARFEKIRSGLEALFPGFSADMAPYLAALLGIPLEGDAADRVRFLQPPQLRAMIFGCVGRFIEGLSARRPVILYLDDLHWIDPTSLELLQSLLPLTDRAPLVVIAAFRPRRQDPAWNFHELVERDYPHRYQKIILDPLDEGQSKTLVASLLEIEDLPEDVRAKILEKSEGNPFFVEELIRSLLDSNLVVRVDGHWQAAREIEKLVLPDTLVGLITTRLDQLDEPTRHLVQAAAVLGREFSSEVLADITQAPDSIEPGLVNLQRRELVVETGHALARTFSFKHALTQEAAYESILLSNRRELHRRTAESLIARSLEDAAEIARHLLQARQAARAVPFLVQAGDKAARAYAMEEAIGFYQQAMDLLNTVEDPEIQRRAYEGLGNALGFTNRLPEAIDTFQKMLEFSETTGDKRMQISALNKMASIYALQAGRFQEAEHLLDQAEDLSHKHGEKASFPESAIIRCQMCTAKGDFRNVVRYMGEVVEIGQELGTKEHISMGLEHIASSLAYMTRFDEAYEKALEGLEAARAIGDREHEAGVLAFSLPFAYVRKGDFDTARRLLSEGLEISTKIGSTVNHIISAYLLSVLASWQGEYERALHYGLDSLKAALPVEDYMPFMLIPPLGVLGMIYLDINEKFTDKIAEFHMHALRLLESPTARMTGGTAWADLGHCAIALGDLQTAEEVLQKGLNYPNMFIYLERPRNLAGAALLASVKGDSREATRLAEEARGYAQERGMRHLYPLTDLIRGKVLVAAGEIDRGLDVLEQAEAEALELGMRPVVWQARAAAANVLEESGRREEAAEKRIGARSMALEIADLFKDQDLRAAYLENVSVKLGEAL